jgi:hypothetical protein
VSRPRRPPPPQNDVANQFDLLAGAAFTLQELRDSSAPGREPLELQVWDAPAPVKQLLQAMYQARLLRGRQGNIGPVLMAQLSELSEAGAMKALRALQAQLVHGLPPKHTGGTLVALLRAARGQERL